MMHPGSGNIDWDAKIVVRSKQGPTQTSAKRPTQKSSENLTNVEKKQKPLNKHSSTQLDHRHAAKVDRETDEFHIKHVSLDVSRAIQKARAEKNWSQKDFAMKISESTSVVASYEQGKAIPNQIILAKMERELGVKLRGKDIGTPLPTKANKLKKETATSSATTSTSTTTTPTKSKK